MLASKTFHVVKRQGLFKRRFVERKRTVAALQAFYDCTGGASKWKANNWPSREHAVEQDVGTDNENFDDEEFDDDDDETQEDDQNRSTAVEAAATAAAAASASSVAAAQRRIESTSLVGVPDFHEYVH